MAAVPKLLLALAGHRVASLALQGKIVQDLVLVGHHEGTTEAVSLGLMGFVVRCSRPGQAPQDPCRRHELHVVDQNLLRVVDPG